MPYKRYPPASEDEMEKIEGENPILTNRDPVSMVEMEPALLEDMDKKRYAGHHSICQTLRDIYHMTDNDDVKLKCRLAVSMAKAMHEQLKKYKVAQENKNDGKEVSNV
jgi:hypothetical protein